MKSLQNVCLMRIYEVLPFDIWWKKVKVKIFSKSDLGSEADSDDSDGDDDDDDDGGGGDDDDDDDGGGGNLSSELLWKRLLYKFVTVWDHHLW